MHIEDSFEVLEHQILYIYRIMVFIYLLYYGYKWLLIIY
jgi:hypothetical protein